jgi:hypothetical protein
MRPDMKERRAMEIYLLTLAIALAQMCVLVALLGRD